VRPVQGRSNVDKQPSPKPFQLRQRVLTRGSNHPPFCVSQHGAHSSQQIQGAKAHRFHHGSKYEPNRLVRCWTNSPPVRQPLVRVVGQCGLAGAGLVPGKT